MFDNLIKTCFFEQRTSKNNAHYLTVTTYPPIDILKQKRADKQTGYNHRMHQFMLSGKGIII